MINKMLNFLFGEPPKREEESTVETLPKVNTYEFPNDGTVHYSDSVPSHIIPNKMLPPNVFDGNLCLSNLGRHRDFPSDFHVLARPTTKREKGIQ